MNPRKLVKMANEIGAFFASNPDPAAARDGVADHLKRFWDPRMRRELLRFIEEDGGEGLEPHVLNSIRIHRDRLAPPPPHAG
jgi:formate dehydrogenase subunit delta